MRRIIFLFLLLSLSDLFAQKKARDFTVTTTDKKQLSLYGDYLNKGKFVVLKIMFVDCPPCNEIAPYLSPIYKKYGSGKDKVEFIELSNKYWDTDPAMIGYKIKYDLPFPAASNDGGSVEASMMYEDNYLGPYYGTPTFVIINPDGTFDWDPKGNNAFETSVKLDTSIARAIRYYVPPTPTPTDTTKTVPPTDTTKTVPPTDTTKTNPKDTTKNPPIVKPDTIKLNGSLSFKANGLGLVSIKFNINGVDYPASTVIGGNFNFTLPDTIKNPGPVSINIAYNQDIGSDVSTIDLVLIQKHILGVQSLTSFKQLIAADANSDGEVNVVDLLEIKKVILGLSDKFPNNTPSVQFIFQNANNIIRNLKYSIPYTDLKAMTDIPFNIEVVKTGDVNLN